MHFSAENQAAVPAGHGAAKGVRAYVFMSPIWVCLLAVLLIFNSNTHLLVQSVLQHCQLKLKL